jgi:saccharopine dehydrogenase (NAD+, L-lysine-forming)
MSKVLIIGAGGVGSVVTTKCAMRPDIFSDIVLASRTVSRCEAIRDAVRSRLDHEISVDQIDADDVSQTVRLIERERPNLVLNVALPYQDLAIMDACLATGVDYLDTANYEPPDEARFCYKWQWDYHQRFEEAGIMALLGCGFDPGVTSVFCSYAQKHHFDRIDEIDILDCNGGDHGKAFATNFNPEINIREITQRGKYWENGEWIETDPLSVSDTFDFPEVGPRKMYLMYHEELESLARFIPDVRRIRFWMTFGDEYLTHLRVLQNVGMTRIDPVEFEGHEIVPLKFLKAVLPDPGSLAEGYSGKTCIGCIVRGQKDGTPKEIYIYNVCDHEVCFDEVGSQAVSYTTGVPAMIGASLMLDGIWRGKGVFNVEQMDPDPFMKLLGEHGLPWMVTERTVTER